MAEALATKCGSFANPFTCNKQPHFALGLRGVSIYLEIKCGSTTEVVPKCLWIKVSCFEKNLDSIQLPDTDRKYLVSILRLIVKISKRVGGINSTLFPNM